jgi:hypothetical protein
VMLHLAPRDEQDRILRDCESLHEIFLL